MGQLFLMNCQFSEMCILLNIPAVRCQNRTWNGSMNSDYPSSVLCCLPRKVTKMKAHDKERQRKSIEKAMKRKDDDAQEEMSSVSFSFFKQERKLKFQTTLVRWKKMNLTRFLSFWKRSGQPSCNFFSKYWPNPGLFFVY